MRTWNMLNRTRSIAILKIIVVTLFLAAWGWSQQASDRRRPQGTQTRDAVVDAQTTKDVPVTRPEQRKTEHDRSEIFKAPSAESSSPALDNQPEQGKMTGFDFARDPLNAKRPMVTFEEIMKEDVALKLKVMELQRRLLEKRYILQPRLDSEVKMSRGKPLPVGPTARLADGLSWERLAEMSPEDIRKLNAFPYPSL